MDWALLFIGILLIATLTAFFTGIIPYPVGWIILLVLFCIRIMQKTNKKN